jgi:hypothetical protein
VPPRPIATVPAPATIAPDRTVGVASSRPARSTFYYVDTPEIPVSAPPGRTEEQVESEEGGSIGLMVASILGMVILCIVFALMVYGERKKKLARRERLKILQEPQNGK